MAPEQFRERVCKENDQYALGCVAYELFTGHAPFLASGAIALLYQHVSVPPVPLRQHNPQLPEHIEPGSPNSIYTLTLTLKNGGTPNWYVGADAIRFNCSSTLPQ